MCEIEFCDVTFTFRYANLLTIIDIRGGYGKNSRWSVKIWVSHKTPMKTRFRWG